MQRHLLKKQFITALMLLMGVFAHAQVPAYYSGTDITQIGQALKSDLANLITITQAVELTYTPGVWDALKQSDLDPTNANNVLLIYGSDDTDGNLTTDRSRNKDLNGGDPGDWNREHTYPRSLGNPNLGSEGPGSDAHHLRPSDITQNSLRSNLPFIDGSGVAARIDNAWYPGDEWKGDVARMMMFMYTRYGDRCLATTVAVGPTTFSPEMPDVLLLWNAEDPVSQFEITRNNVIAAIQGNRNPFIDNPAFATSIWGGPQAEDRFGGQATAPAAPSITATAISETEITLSVTANADNNPIVLAYNEGTGTVFGTPTGTYTAGDAITGGGTILFVGNASDVVNHTGLIANTAYEYKVWSLATDIYSVSGSLTTATTQGGIVVPPTGDFIAAQGFESSANDTWNYTLSTPSCNDGGNDVWDVVTSVGSITTANGGTSFFGVRDLQGNCGSSSTVLVAETISFDAIDVSAYENVALTFSLNVVGFDSANGDNIIYELFYDGIGQGQVTVTTTSPYSTVGWEQITATVPNSVSGFSLVLSVAQNGGSDYAGFDDIQLSGDAISTVPSVLINEVDADTPSTDTLEFVELYDGGAGNTALDGLVLVNYNGSNDTSYNALDLDGFTTNALGFLIIGNAAVENVDIVVPGNYFQNGADAIALYTGDAADFPNGTAVATENIVDAFVYDTNDGDDAGLLILLNDGQAQINEGGLGDKDNHSSQRKPDGSGGARNTSTYTQAVPTPGKVNEVLAVPPTILINELDADTAGVDTLEFVELYDGGVGNSSLDGFVLVNYNGSNDTSYSAIDLDGFTTNSAGYFVIGNAAVANVDLVVNSNAFQNGADAVVLYQADAADFPNGTAIVLDNIIDAIVYDTNDGDDAGLLVLLNAGQLQLNEGELGNKDGHSLQRIPNGEGGTRNTASYTQLEPTPGAINEVPAEPVTIIINEADADTAGTDTGEFVELYDGGVGNSPLDGLVLVFYNGSNDSSYAAYDLDGFTTNVNGYFVLGNSAVPNTSIVFASNGLQNGADGIGLYEANAADFPNGTAISTANLIDALVYDTNDGDDAGLLALLNAGQPQMNEGGQGNKDGHSNQRFENGTGGLRNTSSYVQAIPTPGAANTNALEAIDLIINEIDADTAGSDTKEFVELYDGGTGNTSLDGFVLVNYNGNGDTSYNALDLDGYTTNAEGYFVVGNAAVANVDVVVPGNYFQNGADAVVLYQGDATDFPNGTAIGLNNIIDAVVYDTNDSDDAGLLALLNIGEAQLNEGELGNKDGHSLQRIPNGEGGARNTSTYVPDTPTPGTENGAAVVPTDPIPIVDARAAIDGTQVTITGVLTVADNLGGSAYIQDTTGAIAVFDEAVHGDGVFAVGDSITITGIRSMFNEQLQISPVLLVESNGLPNQPIEPLTITLAELSQHPAELVRIVNPSFPKPGDILFGSANYVLTDTSGTGELRIDNSVESIVGLGQPESCSEVIGVVGRFFETFQLLPRLREDLACAVAYENPANAVTVDKSLTFDIVTWNIEWFGDEQNSPAAGDPMSDAIQKDSVKSVITRLNADIIAVQEIADDALFAQMVNELSGYSFVLSDAVSRPNDPGVSQKVGFIYKTETVTNVSTKVLLQSIHPLYNGGDDSALINYPSTTDRFYASGRLPFMLSADVMIEGETKPFNIVGLHARANGSTDAQLRYDMRKYDVEVLKDSLDVMYPNANIILLGDYNDDVDVTVADVATTVSTYEEYIADTVNYNILTAVLSEDGFRSFVSRENMIDHISVSDELIENNINEAISVHYEFYDADYTRTTSDHLPVSTRLQLNVLSLEPAILTNVSCNGATDGTISIEAKGGIKPYSYQWSDGQTRATASGLSAGIYSLTVTDALGTSLTSEVVITEPTALVLSLVEDQTVYFGYEAASCTTLSVVELFGGNPSYSYEWSTGESTEAIEVCPQETTVYSLTVTDANGCTVTAAVTVEVIDVRCGNNPRNPKVEVCFNGQNLCISVNAVPTFLNRGASLGACNEVVQEIVITNLETFPNPFTSSVNVWLRSAVQADVAFVIYDFYGNIVHQSTSRVYEGTYEINISGLDSLRTGYYYLKPMVNGRAQATKVLLKN